MMFRSFRPSENFTNATSKQQIVMCNIYDNSSPVKMGKIILFSSLLFSSLVGNALIIAVVYKREELRKTINIFIVNMAFSDLAFPLTSIPFHLTQLAYSSRQWPVGGTAGLICCKLRWFLQGVSVTVSIQSLVWIAIDRFVAVVLPMKVRRISSRFRFLAIASTWILAILINGQDFYAFDFLKADDAKRICTRLHKTANTISNMTYVAVRIAFVFILPLILVTILYCSIAVTLRRRNKDLDYTAVQKKHHRKLQAIKMSVCIMTAFYICVVPMAVAIASWEYGILGQACSFYKDFMSFAFAMVLLSSTINPIICLTFVKSYRRGLVELLRWNNLQSRDKQLEKG